MGLPREAPDPTGFRTKPCEDDDPRFGKLMQMVRVPEEERQANFRTWHEEGRRGKLASEISRGVHKVGYGLSYGGHLGDRLSYPVRRRLFWHELATARTITWNAWHYSLAGQTTEIDGRLVLPNGRDWSFDITTNNDQTFWIDEDYRNDGGAGREDRYASGCPTALVAATSLTPALLLVALRGWYVQRFEWERGHWAVLERTLPEFKIDAAWENTKKSECYTKKQLAKFERVALASELRVLELLENKGAKATFALYGAEAVPEELRTSIAKRKEKLKK